jgi:oligoendopeptidase F
MKSNYAISFRLMVVILLFLGIKPYVSAQTLNRDSVDIKYKWKLEDLYATDEDWYKSKDKLKDDIDKLESYRGKIGASSKSLLDFLNFYFNISKEYSRLYCYAYMKLDQDTRQEKYLLMKQLIEQVGSAFDSHTTFNEPEVLALGKDKIDQYLQEEKGLHDYKMYLYELFRKKEHLLSEAEEKILSYASTMMERPYNTYKVFKIAEFPYPEVTLSTGETVKLDQAGYVKYRMLENRSDRELVIRTYYNSFSKFKRTFAEYLLAEVQSNIFNARSRKYSSSLESSLFKYNIPLNVYHSLIKNVNQNLPVFHRYLSIIKRIHGFDTLKFTDLNADVVKDFKLRYTYEEAKDLVYKSLSPMGKDYQSVIARALNERWIDVYSTEAKFTGVYSYGIAYDTHPYILLNYSGEYSDVNSLAHELGHTLHSYLSNKKQPFPTSRYSRFSAEVASSFNEHLLMQQMIQNKKNDNIRLSLLMEELDGFRISLFTQTMYAEFELLIHEKVEAGEALTSDVLNQLFGNLNRKYYGHNKGICYIEEPYFIYWAMIPHFYNNFYVYQYATSYTASAALAEKVLSKEKDAVEKYLAFLSAGGSEYPIDLLKKAGVDMTSSEPFDKAIASMNKVMDEVEAILKKQGK